MAIADLRREYALSALDRGDLAADPILQFQRWFDDAAGKKTGRVRRFCVDLYKAFHALFSGTTIDPNAMALATADKDGQPSVRMVLLKGVDQRGFTFFTNYNSRKGRELTENPRGALVFHWAELERQVCVSGTIAKLSKEESEAYFRSRPRGSRIAAWASDQSSILADRNVLERKFQEIEHQFAGKDVAIPEFWGGYVLKPQRIEFWQGRVSRMHDRFCYLREGETWKVERLSP